MQPPFFIISYRWLSNKYHGKEMPPISFTKFFQAMLDHANFGSMKIRLPEWYYALHELEQLQPPVITTAQWESGMPIKKYVPGNHSFKEILDKPVIKLTGKDECPIFFDKNEKWHGHYAFSVQNVSQNAISCLIELTESVMNFGLGVDTVICNACLSNDFTVPDNHEMWLPFGNKNGICKSVPAKGYLDDLLSAYQERVDHGSGRYSYKYKHILYNTELEHKNPTIVPFSIQMYHDKTYPIGGDATKVTAWLRHSVIQRMKEIEELSEDDSKYFSAHFPKPLSQIRYVALPSIGHKYTDLRIRRVAIIIPPKLSHFVPLVKRCAGLSLYEEKKEEPVAILEPLDMHEKVVKRYCRPSKLASTIVPASLPFHPTKKKKFHKGNAKKNIDEMFGEIGLLEHVVRWQFSRHPLHENGIKIHNMQNESSPDRSRNPLYHLKVEFDTEVPGPILIGQASPRGYGLMAKMDSSDGSDS